MHWFSVFNLSLRSSGQSLFGDWGQTSASQLKAVKGTDRRINPYIHVKTF